MVIGRSPAFQVSRVTLTAFGFVQPWAVSSLTISFCVIGIALLPPDKIIIPYVLHVFNYKESENV